MTRAVQRLPAGLRAQQFREHLHEGDVDKTAGGEGENMRAAVCRGGIGRKRHARAQQTAR